MHKSFFLLITILFWNNISYSSGEINKPFFGYFTIRPSIERHIKTKYEEDKDWKLETETDGIRIESKIVECTKTNLGFDRELVILRFTNLTERDLLISYDFIEYRNEVCTTCDKMPEYRYQVMLKAKSSLEGDCLNTNLNQLKIFSHFLDPRFRKLKDELTDFQFKNIVVLEVKNIKK